MSAAANGSLQAGPKTPTSGSPAEQTRSGHFFSQKYNDIYFTQEDPEAEKQFVFVETNRIAGRIRDSETFTVAELGFGFGLNYALTVHAAKQTDCLQRLRYFSVEESFPDMEQAELLISKLKICREEFLTFWKSSTSRERGAPVFPLPDAAEGPGGGIHHTDVLTFLAEATFLADAWYFDGFSPAKNPAMWSVEVFTRAFALTKSGGTFSTYSAAGWVKRNLEAAGFVTQKIPGYGAKREMLTGYKP